jgi:hypothetical protein
MEITGLNDFIVWMYDQNGKVITDPESGGFSYDGDKGKVFTQKDHKEVKGLFKVDLESSLGATQANITGLAPSVSRVYGSNYVAEVNTGAEQPSIALAANDIPHGVYDLLTGLSKDKQNAGGYARQGKAATVNGGVIAHSYNTHKNIDLYFAFPFGVFVPGELNMGTNTENPNVVHDALTLNVQARGKDLLLYEKFYSDEPSFDFDQMIEFITGASAAGTTSPKL